MAVRLGFSGYLMLDDRQADLLVQQLRDMDINGTLGIEIQGDRKRGSLRKTWDSLENWYSATTEAVLNPLQMNIILEHLSNNQRILAIKTCRQMLGIIGLKDAKAVIDEIDNTKM